MKMTRLCHSSLVSYFVYVWRWWRGKIISLDGLAPFCTSRQVAPIVYWTKNTTRWITLNFHLANTIGTCRHLAENIYDWREMKLVRKIFKKALRVGRIRKYSFICFCDSRLYSEISKSRVFVNFRQRSFNISQSFCLSAKET